jgi:HPt (histidine-containing phosphotransfer) domain-containing protein
VDYELDELKREFLAEAEEKVREIEGALSGERNSQALDRLAYLAHQLKGAGGSYGYQRISSEAAEIEKAAERIVKGEADGGIETRLQQHVTDLRSEIEKSIKELAT